MGSVILAKLLAKETSEYVGHFMDSEFALKNLRSASGASAQQAIYIRDVRSCPIPLPPATEIETITHALRESKEIGFSVGDVVAESESSLTQLDQSILAKAFRGELVPQDPRDEPASELLARIRTTREAEAATKKKPANRNAKS